MTRQCSQRRAAGINPYFKDYITTKTKKQRKTKCCAKKLEFAQITPNVAGEFIETAANSTNIDRFRGYTEVTNDAVIERAASLQQTGSANPGLGGSCIHWNYDTIFEGVDYLPGAVQADLVSCAEAILDQVGETCTAVGYTCCIEPICDIADKVAIPSLGFQTQLSIADFCVIYPTLHCCVKMCREEVCLSTVP